MCAATSAVVKVFDMIEEEDGCARLGVTGQYIGGRKWEERVTGKMSTSQRMWCTARSSEGAASTMCTVHGDYYETTEVPPHAAISSHVALPAFRM